MKKEAWVTEEPADITICYWLSTVGHCMCVAINRGCIMCLCSEVCQMVAAVLGADVRLPGRLSERVKREMRRRAKKHQSFISLTAAILLNLNL